MLDYDFPAEANVEISGELVLNNGAGPKIEIVPSDIVQNSMVLRSGTSLSDEFTVGAAVIGSLGVKLLNTSGKFSDINWVRSQFKFTFSAEGHTVTADNYWTVSHKENGDTITIEAYDAMRIFDEHKIYELNVTWPVDAKELVDKIVKLGFGETVNVTGIDGLAGIMLDDPKDDRMTCRTCLSYVAQLICRYIQFKPPRTIDFSWYNLREIYDAGTTFTHDLRTGYVTVDGVKVTANDDETTATYGEGEELITISGNPFVTPENVQTVANTIGAAVQGLMFTPGSFEIVGNPAIEAGDLLSINTGEKQHIRVLATNIMYKPGQLTESITSDYYPEADDLRITPAEYVKRVIDQELKNPNSELSKAISGGAGGKGGYTPQEIYARRPADWLPMPSPGVDEAYILLQYPSGVGYKARESTAVYQSGTGIHVEILDSSGGVIAGKDNEYSQATLTLDFDADLLGSVTSDGYAQGFLHITGSGITSISVPLANAVEFAANTPSLTALSQSEYGSSNCVRYFSLLSHAMTSARQMFMNWRMLRAVPVFDTSKITDMSYMFSSCTSLEGVVLDGAAVERMDYAFQACQNLRHIEISGGSELKYMSNALASLPVLEVVKIQDTSTVANMDYMLSQSTMRIVDWLDFSSVTSMTNIINSAYVQVLKNVNLKAMTSTLTVRNENLIVFEMNPSVSGWAGVNIDLYSTAITTSIQALVDSLPTITTEHKIRLSGNYWTSEQEAQALAKGWVLTTQYV